jgi:hypothetical protein
MKTLTCSGNTKLGTAIVAEALYELLYSARIVLTNGAVERDELFLPHTRTFRRERPFDLLVLLGFLTLDSRLQYRRISWEGIRCIID